MATVRWNSFFPYVSPDVLECPDITVEIAIRDAATEFCQRTHVWKELSDLVTTQVGESLYDLEPPSGAVVEKILGLQADGEPLEFTRVDHLPRQWTTSTGTPIRAVYETDDQIRLYPTPDEAGDYRAVFVLTPSANSSGLPGRIFERYRETIAHGAKHRLMMTPGKTWSNPSMASYHMSQFMRGVNDAKIRNDHGVSNKVLPHPFR